MNAKYFCIVLMNIILVYEQDTAFEHLINSICVLHWHKYCRTCFTRIPCNHIEASHRWQTDSLKLQGGIFDDLEESCLVAAQQRATAQTWGQRQHGWFDCALAWPSNALCDDSIGGLVQQSYLYWLQKLPYLKPKSVGKLKVKLFWTKGRRIVA